MLKDEWNEVCIKRLMWSFGDWTELPGLIVERCTSYRRIVNVQLSVSETGWREFPMGFLIFHKNMAWVSLGTASVKSLSQRTPKKQTAHLNKSSYPG